MSDLALRVLPDPVARLADLIRQARDLGVRNPDAMALATADADGAPSVRYVLLRGLDNEGLVFYTSYDSVKGAELAVNPAASAAFYWPDLGRQARATGPVEHMPTDLSERYFSGRPRGHQLAAWASEQSNAIANEEALEERFAEVERRFEGTGVPLPPFWGGFRLRPARYEFWEERENRMHHRIQLDRMSDGGWASTILQP